MASSLVSSSFASTVSFTRPRSKTGIVALAALLAPLLFSAAPRAARAGVPGIAQNNTVTGSFTGFMAQSVTLSPPNTGNGYNTLILNFYTANGSSLGGAIAPGTVYLLSQTYTGTPDGLSTSTPGYIARATGASSAYTFSSSVALLANTSYYFYVDGTGSAAYGVGGDGYAGGGMASSTSSSSGYSSIGSADSAFRLQGTPTTLAAAAPEPGTLPLFSMGLTAGLGMVGTLSHRSGRREMVNRRETKRARQ